MRSLVLALLVAGTVAAETPDYPMERITFTRAELDAMQQELEGMVRKREEAAFQRGQADVRERCPALVRLM